MEIKTLSLLILRAIAASGFAISLILLSFSQQLLHSHQISLSDQSPLSGSLLALALAIPIALWILSPRIVKHSCLLQQRSHSMIDMHEVLVLVIIISAVSLISRGLVEMAVSILSTLTLDAVPNAVLVVNLDQSGSFGLRGATQIICGAALLWAAPLLTGNIAKILVRRPQ